MVLVHELQVYFSNYPSILNRTARLLQGVAESATQFTLGQAKEELLTVLGLQEQGSSLEFLRRGYKVWISSHLVDRLDRFAVFFPPEILSATSASGHHTDFKLLIPHYSVFCKVSSMPHVFLG